MPAGSLANAASVGANTVNGPLPFSVSTSPAACSAAARVLNDPAATAVSTMSFVAGAALTVAPNDGRGQQGHHRTYPEGLRKERSSSALLLLRVRKSRTRPSMIHTNEKIIFPHSQIDLHRQSRVTRGDKSALCLLQENDGPSVPRENPLYRMAQPTLTDELRRYEIGAKLRALRLKKKLGLVELGRHTGLSPALLSKLERGKMFPTLQTLLRIAMVFSVDLDYFFADHRKHRAFAIVRRAARQRFPEAAGRRDPAYHFESLTFPVAEPSARRIWRRSTRSPRARRGRTSMRASR